MRRARSWLPGALMAVALASGAAVAGQVETTEAASGITVDLDLGTVTPGTAVSRSIDVAVPAPATVVRSQWVILDGLAQDLDWDIELCGAASCIDVEPPRVGDQVPPGDYRLVVEASLAPLVAGDGRALGVITLAADDGVLSQTGGSVPWVTIALAAAAVGSGVFAVSVAARRRGRAGQESAP
ncbi:hypothetical protein [uncultured Demequina sp.]|uniref:hypothetical protein n=1 Tax=uncultured Demequina sp. TaxID=693499 RepID=UPI0025E7B2FA|nr:hypothetical protein [uncultured Demequina sp.]